MGALCKIISWNINSVRSRVGIFKRLLAERNPDIVLLQETKVTDDVFPYQEFEDTSYNISVHGQKSYNGVAIFSKTEIDVIQKGFNKDFGDFNEEARFLYVATNGFQVASLYAPNGQEVGAFQYYYKLAFYDELLSLMREEKGEDFLLGGDFNIALTDNDVYNPVAWAGKNTCSEEERKKMRAMIADLDFHDVWREMHGEEREYSWWDYRFQGFQKNYGLRIDYFMASASLNKKVQSCSVLRQYRAMDKPSDHAPIEIEINI